MKALAAEGRTVFVSSHLMSEMQHTADHLLVIGRGRLIADCTVAEFIEQNSEHQVRVRTTEPDRLAEVVTAAGGRAAVEGTTVQVWRLPVERIGDLAFDNGIRLHELTVVQASLEEAFMELTKEAVEYHAAVPAPQSPSEKVEA
jgi:ABC-2 type transport system ATP-binding protein